MTDDLDAELAALGKAMPARMCGVAWLYQRIVPPTEAAKLDAALLDGYRATDIHRLMIRRYAADIPASTVIRHARGIRGEAGCRCQPTT